MTERELAWWIQNPGNLKTLRGEEKKTSQTGNQKWNINNMEISIKLVFLLMF